MEERNQKDPVPDLTNKLGHYDLLILFSWLCAEELITMKRVCHSWRVAAQNNSLWKDYTLTLSTRTTCKDENKIKLMPHVRNINGRTNISMLNVILEHVDKLIKLNVEFEPPLSPLQVALVLEKYPQLESITLCSCNPDILESLNMLKSSEHLKEINFNCFGKDLRECYNSFPSDDIFKLFSDCKNFPSLRSIIILDNKDFKKEIRRNESFRNTVIDVITKRSHQLLSLKFDIGLLDSLGLLNAISSCTKLQTLHLCVSPVNTCINFQNMTELRSLHLHIIGGGSMFLSMFHDNLSMGSLACLTEISVLLWSYGHNGGHTLKTIIDNANQLKILEYSDLFYAVSEHCIEHISRLKNLQSFNLEGLRNISEEVINYISECRGLKRLELRSNSSTITRWHSCFTNMFCKLSDLRYISIKNNANTMEATSLYIILESKNEIKEHLSEIVWYSQHSNH